jgi:adenylylsulfate kinase
VSVAAALHQSWRILECVCSEDMAKQRLEHQAMLGAHPASNRDFQLYLEVRSRFEAITLPKTVIDTGNPLPTCVEQAVAALR